MSPDSERNLRLVGNVHIDVGNAIGAASGTGRPGPVPAARHVATRWPTIAHVASVALRAYRPRTRTGKRKSLYPRGCSRGYFETGPPLRRNHEPPIPPPVRTRAVRLGVGAPRHDSEAVHRWRAVATPEAHCAEPVARGPRVRGARGVGAIGRKEGGVVVFCPCFLDVSAPNLLRATGCNRRNRLPPNPAGGMETRVARWRTPRREAEKCAAARENTPPRSVVVQFGALFTRFRRRR